MSDEWKSGASETSPSEFPARLNEDMPSIYFDGVRIHLSPATVTMEFSLSRPSAADGPEELVARLRLSPQTLLVFGSLIGQMVGAFEESFGPISPKPELTTDAIEQGPAESENHEST